MNVIRTRMLAVALGAIALLTAAGPACADSDVVDNGGPIMSSPSVFLIYWLPSGFSYDRSVADGTGNYRTLMQRFFTDLGGSAYFNVLTQYPGTCGIAAAPPATCFGPVSVGATTLDTTPYPHAGTVNDPLLDADIRAEITRFIAANPGVTPGLNTEFFVFTGAGVQECASFGCTQSFFCAYHSEFSDAAGRPVVYTMMPDVDSFGRGCASGISRAVNGQISTDREIVTISHEFFESVSDPMPNSGWSDPASDGSEIGDKCNANTAGVGSLGSDNANVTLSGNRYVVQPQWSNDSAGCAVGFAPAILGPSIEYKIGTGGDDLRDNSVAVAASQAFDGSVLQSDTLKAQGQSSWGNNSTRVRVFAFNSPSTMLGNVAFTLTSHSGFLQTGDNWDVQSLDLAVRDGIGNVLCSTSSSGNPLARLTGSAATATFGTPACRPALPIGLMFDRIVFNVTTGEDDLRDNSSASASVAVNGATQTFTLKAQSEPSWENGSNHGRTFTLASAQPFSAFQSVSLGLTSHNGFLQTDDNWNVQNLVVTLLSPGGEACLVNQAGAPLVRLTGSAGTAAFAVPNCGSAGVPPGTPLTATFDTVTFDVTTGDDDLRDNSSAAASVLVNGAPQTFTLKAQSEAGWENFTRHTRTFALSSPQPLSAFGNVVVTMASHNGFLQTDDNWNVQRIDVSVSLGGGAPTCLARVSGTPFARLHPSAASATITPRRGC